ncbi:hypothetical protein KAS41_01900 [Candidatus Parcubacteria bacterium]|nr:hypothetical protein [Candidatus Parcubacteria bacterium]
MNEQNKKLNLKKTSDEKISDEKSEIIELLEENLKVSRRILKLSKKTQSWILLQKIKSVVYFILIIAPIILAAIYLPPILSGLLEQYQELLNIFPNK